MSRLLERTDDNFIETETANKSDNGEVSFCHSKNRFDGSKCKDKVTL